MKEIKKINVISLAKILGLSLAILGFIVGLVVGFIMFVIGSFFGTSNGMTLLAPSLGIIGFLIIPLLFGAIGFLLGGLSTLIYNLLASWVGGIEIEIGDKESD
jgi:hypothetical protein